MAFTTIDNPELYFQVKLYTGTGSEQAITLDGSEDMQPDLVYAKGRSNATSPSIHDSVRGATLELYTSSTAAEGDYNETLKSFDSDGFTVGTDGGWNGSGQTKVAWCWKESADAGMDIVGYTGNGSNRTISHSLSAVPNWMILKNREDTKSWVVYHHKNTSAPETEYLLLDGTGATTDFAGYFNDTAPTSSVFTVGTGTDANASGDDFIAYLWSEKQGFSKFGGWSVTSNSNRPFIFTGFKPAWLMIKKTNSGGSVSWYIFDNKRSPINAVDDFLKADANDAEGGDGNAYIDFLSNGFKLKTGNIGTEAGGTFVYMAFAEAPFVNSNGVPCNAR